MAVSVRTQAVYGLQAEVNGYLMMRDKQPTVQDRAS